MDIDGLKYHYIDQGQGDPILFVHGNPTWSFAWRNFVPTLSKTHRTIAVDHIGCGYSSKPQNYKYELAQHIDNLQALVEHLDLKNITLVAHDWGGAIGMGAAGRMPERFKQFVLMNTGAFRSKRIPLRIAVCRIPVFGSLAIRGLNLFARSALVMAVTKRDRMTPAIKAGYLAPYNSWKNRIATHQFVIDIPLRDSHVSYNSLVEVESGLVQFKEHPMRLIWGEKDWCFTTKFLEEFEQRFPKAETVRIGDAGHYVFEDAQAQVLEQLTEFVSSHSK